MADRRQLVTANLARGTGGTWAWLEEMLGDQDPAVVFGQELAGRDRLEQLAAQHGYAVIWPAVEMSTQWQVVSWVMAKLDLRPRRSTDLRLLDKLRVHGSYAAAAEVDWPGFGTVSAISVHASPKPVPPDGLAGYPEAPSPRDGGTDGRYGGRLFYSDLLLDAVAEAALRTQVLAAGDLNEARAWDRVNEGHTWGAEFFSRVDSRGLVDVTFELWSEERRTRFHATHPEYQLDVVLASPAIARLITDASVDGDWTADNLASRSDHAPVWFSMEHEDG